MTISTDTSPIAAWLLEECENRNLSWSQASRRAGVSRGMISAIVNGQRPGLETCKALAGFFKVPPERVLRLAGHLSNPPAPQHSEEEEIITVWGQLPAWKREDLLLQARTTIEAQRQKEQRQGGSQPRKSTPTEQQ